MVPRWPRGRSTHTARSRARHLATGLASALVLTGCSFFQLSPTTEGTAPARPATPPAAPKPAAKPTPPPVEPKPAPVTKATTPKPPKAATKRIPPATPPVVVAASPPVVRRPEPIIEPPAVEPPATGSDSAGVARLVRAASLWDAVRLYHPAVVGKRVAWDNATVRRLTDVRGAITREQYARVLREWLGVLHDEATWLEDHGSVDASGTSAGSSATTSVVTATVRTATAGIAPLRPSDSTVVVTWPERRAGNDSMAWAAMAAVGPTLETSPRVVIDLRHQLSVRDTQPAGDQPFVRAAQEELASRVASASALGPGIRRRLYEGWPDERVTGASSLGRALWRTSDPLAVITVDDAPATVERHIVIVADSTTFMPPALLALVSAGQATLVAEGGMSDRLLVPTSAVAMGDGLVAHVRVGELINANGSTGIEPDTVVPRPASPGDSAPALQVALRAAHGARSMHRPTPPSVMSQDAELATAGWNTPHYPIMGARLLGAFKLWGTLRAFHAYGELRDETIDDAFLRAIPRVEAARDADGYAAAILDFATSTDDAASTVTGPSVTQHIGAAYAPFRARWIEGRAIVTQVASDSAGRASGLAVGEEISAADGFPMPAYVGEHRRYGAASNDWTRLRNIMGMLPRGAAGDASYRARDVNGRERSLTITRSTGSVSAVPDTERYGTPVWRDLSGGIGYVDLDRATAAGIDSAFGALSATRALILDARSGSRTSGSISPALFARIVQRLAATPDVTLDRQSLRVATEPCSAAEPGLLRAVCPQQNRQWSTVLAADTLRHYAGRTVMLIDERTQGPLEQLGLALESAAGTVFIGSPSAGAGGEVTAVALPGQLTVTFTGTELRHGDGRQLQRVGLTPQVDAHPTVKGVRAGTDEILQRAAEWLRQQREAPVRRRR